MKAFEIKWGGLTALYAATNRGRARYLAAKDIAEYMGTTVSKALVELRCRRAWWDDMDAVGQGHEGPLQR